LAQSLENVPNPHIWQGVGSLEERPRSPFLFVSGHADRAELGILIMRGRHSAVDQIAAAASGR
jgi:hypothetical protein